MKVIDGCTEYYVTMDGTIISTAHMSTKILKPWVSHDGYEIVQVMSTTGKRVRKTVHRIVAESYIPNPDNKPQVNHINGDKRNNSITNLEWVSLSEQTRHAFDVLGKESKGGGHGHGAVIQLSPEGVEINRFQSANAAGVSTGISPATIGACCKGVKCRKSAGGYKWKYVNH